MARLNNTNGHSVQNTSFQMPSTGTISIWANPNFNSGDSSRHNWWDAAGGASQSLPGFQRFTDNNLYIGFLGGGQGDQRIVIADTGLITSGTWANWIFTWSTGAGQTIYKNAVSKGTHALVAPTLAPSVTCTNFDYSVNMAAFNGGGTFSDFAIWNTILSAGEISALSNWCNPLKIRPAAIVLYWPLFGLTSPEIDFSGSKNNGTVTGTSLAAGPPTAMFTPRWPSNLPAAAATTSFRRVNMPMLGM